MAIKYSKWPQNIPTFFILRPSKNWDFWFENIQSGNPGRGVGEVEDEPVDLEAGWFRRRHRCLPASGTLWGGTRPSASKSSVENCCFSFYCFFCRQRKTLGNLGNLTYCGKITHSTITEANVIFPTGFMPGDNPTTSIYNANNSLARF
jgi:hypothetical protein